MQSPMVRNGNIRDLIGQQFGRLTVLGQDGRARDGHVVWMTRCDCGNTRRVASNNLRPAGEVRSCGCIRRERIAKITIPGWNLGKTYPIQKGEHEYTTRHGWAKAAVRALGIACETCGWDVGRCDVHHRVRRADGGRNVLSNARILCPNCHRIEHG